MSYVFEYARNAIWFDPITYHTNFNDTVAQSVNIYSLLHNSQTHRRTNHTIACLTYDLYDTYIVMAWKPGRCNRLRRCLRKQILAYQTTTKNTICGAPTTAISAYMLGHSGTKRSLGRARIAEHCMSYQQTICIISQFKVYTFIIIFRDQHRPDDRTGVNDANAGRRSARWSILARVYYSYIAANLLVQHEYRATSSLHGWWKCKVMLCGHQQHRCCAFSLAISPQEYMLH